jgi:outer membrane receptor protein involved in Fe transport
MRTLTNDFGNDAKSWMVDSAVNFATRLANNSFYQPGTAEFDSARASIIGNSNLTKGSRFVDNSALYHVEGQYDFKWKFAKVVAGANARLYTPRSYGTIFRDTLINRADTLADGSANRDAEFVTLNNWEVGGFIQASKKITEKLNMIVSVRGDKNQNFKPQFSPRLGLVYTHKDHSFRVGAQSAFRIPTLQNQFINLNLGPISLLGNLDGFTNLYTLNSVQRFNEEIDNTFEYYNVDANILKVVELDPLKPEQVKTIEGGYRGVLFEKLYVDADVFHNWYDNFIGDIRVVRPLNGAQAGEITGFDAILTKDYEVYQIATNASSTVRSYGAGLGLTYYFSSKLSITSNYSFNDINREDLGEDIIPGFNTPKHKVNLGISGTRVWKNFGFSANILWADTYLWESPFGDGQIPSYRVVDAQLSYAPEKINSVFRIGASNLFNEIRREVFGGPFIGRMFYASYTVNLFQPKK